MERMPAATQTLYAELAERLRALEAARSFASLAGTFARKKVSGGDYWYFKTSEGPAGQREYFVGREGAEARALMSAYARERAGAEAELEEIARLCAMLRKGGALVLEAASAKVISGLAAGGVFRTGAVLAGTHAYIGLGNVLGVRWASGLRTQDIDIAATRVLELAVPQAQSDLPGVLKALNMGFLPVPGLDPKSAETSFKVRGQSLRVDLLTPAQGKRNGKPIPIARLKAAAQPMEMLEYLLEAPLAAPLINGGATLVNLPDPARFALHKLLVAARRQAFEQAKADKDRRQAAEMIAVLMQDRPGDLAIAANALNKKPAAWRTRLKRELARLPETLKPASLSVQRNLRD